MLLLVLSYIVLLVALTYGILTQLIIPGLRGTKLFPYFTKEKQLNNMIVDVKQGKHEHDLEQQIKSLSEEKEDQQ